MRDIDKNKIHPPGVDREGKKVRFDYIKSNYFRVVHVDGVFGGNAPRRGYIHVAVWNERWPIPRQCLYSLEENGKLGKEIEQERVMRDAIVREVEVDLIMSIETAKSLRDWLSEKIDNYEKTT
jgi:hypothetical protein